MDRTRSARTSAPAGWAPCYRASDAEAHRRLMFLRDHAGEEYQTSILENVPLHRDIVAAWKEHDG